MSSKNLHLVSLGCTKNLIDSEVMLGRLKDYKITDDPSNADVIIVNTCGFIDAAKEESIQTIMDLHSQRKEDSLLVMSGCLSERYKKELMSELKEVDIFTGVGDYDKIDELILEKKSRFSPKTYLIGSEDRVITGSNAHAYIKLSEGCNQQCSFCAIPHFKGKLQSRELKSVAQEVKSLVKQGFYDFSFISQDSSSYLRDQGVSDGLGYLIDEIEKIDGVFSARILYLYPSTLSLEVLGKISKSDIFHNYFDMPIQHISEHMLKLMRRGAGQQTIKSQLNFMRSAKDSFLRTSIIVGHPGESDEDFKELVSFLKEFRFDRVNIFEYSDEEQTKAFSMSEKVSKDIVNKRVKILEDLVKKNQKISLKEMIGKERDIVLVGQSSEGEFFYGARDLVWAPEIDGEILVNESECDVDIGGCYKAKITELAGDKLLATIIRPS
ncbi:MAG: 30S ribosomal protein S12 methylthiotransferase RimO [Sulfurospirillum sp.]|nr:MAG: 30S ribosomal protein S12 methylthiotransferase RimO [Sulfurospirillum sp.]